MNTYRTHYCNQLRQSDENNEVIISGWINRKRDHGNVLFVDLRDHYGVTQCVVEKTNKLLLDTIDNLRSESVIKVMGTVIRRSDDTVNDSLETGEIEVAISNVEILSKAKEIPMPVAGENDYPEEIRLTNRFLDIRREKLHNNLILRSQIISYIRKLMTESGFLEMQTPILTASSPEGARDFLVPSRLHPGKFYALPQAPQQFKQLIMAGGFDKYFQIAPCFRDEDARADRSPGEFYQLDMEMAFAEQEDVFAAIEPVLYKTFQNFTKDKVTEYPFPRLTYKESMERYASDKPDLRNPLIISNLTDQFSSPEVSFSSFKKIIDKGGIVLGIPAPKTSEKPRSFFDSLNKWAQQELNAPGLGYVILDNENDDLTGKGPIAKFIPNNILKNIAAVNKLQSGDSIFFSCGFQKDAYNLASAARDKIALDLDLIEKGCYKFCWITDFPMYEKDEDTGKINFSHNPFSMPQGGLEALVDKNPLDILGYQYDIVCNGVELSSGAIRNHIPEIMFKAFEIAGYEKDQMLEKFGGMINAFSYGVPPHGGIAPGIDRIVMLLAKEKNIREIILFPMNQQAQDLMMLAPAEVDDKNLKELHLKKDLPKED